MSPGIYLLDTNTVSYLVNGRSLTVRANYLSAESAGATIALSTISEAEILFGLAKKPDATRLAANFNRFFAGVQLLPWDSQVARAYGKLRANLASTGKNLALMDLLIASHAVAKNATLVTHDRAFVGASPLLEVIDWVTDL